MAEKDTAAADKSKYISITALGKMRNISSQTLRYYDQIGIFKPDYVDPETGYRYYDPAQYEKLGTIIELRKLNFSLEEIRDFFDGRNVTKSLKMLISHEEALQHELEEKQKLCRVISKKINFIQNVEGGSIREDFYEIQQFPPRHILVDFNSAAGIELQFMHLEHHLKESTGILATDRMGFSCSLNDPELMLTQNNWAPTIFEVEEEDAKSLKHFRTVPAGRYLCVYHKNFKERKEEHLRRLYEYAAANGLKLTGLGLQQFVIDVTLTDDPQETMLFYQFKIADGK